MDHTPLYSVAGRHHQIPPKYAPEEDLLPDFDDTDIEMLSSEYLAHLDQQELLDLDRYIGSDDLERYLKSLETSNEEPVRNELSPPAKPVISNSVPAQKPLSNTLPSMAEWHSIPVDEIPPVTTVNNGTSWLIPTSGSTAEKETTYGNVVVASEVAPRNDTTNVPQPHHIDRHSPQFYRQLLGHAPSEPEQGFAGPESFPQALPTSTFNGSTIPSTYQQFTAAGYPQPTGSSNVQSPVQHPANQQGELKLPNISPPVTRTKKSCRFVCEVCDESLDSQSALRMHYKKRHAPGSGITIPRAAGTRFQCYICIHKSFPSSELLQAHVETHKPYPCLAPDCPHGFLRRSAMMSHYRTHHAK